jgi:hypothetical protein
VRRPEEPGRRSSARAPPTRRAQPLRSRPAAPSEAPGGR